MDLEVLGLKQEGKEWGRRKQRQPQLATCYILGGEEEQDCPLN